MEGTRKQLSHLQQVYSGEVDEKELDHSYQVITFIPVLLKSKLSQELRALLLRQYSEIKGVLRDQELGLLNRSDFYEHAAEEAELEALFAAERETLGDRQFVRLLGYLDDDTKANLEKIAGEHELFKSQMAVMVKSTLGIPFDDVVGPKDIRDFEETEKEY